VAATDNLIPVRMVSNPDAELRPHCVQPHPPEDVIRDAEP